MKLILITMSLAVLTMSAQAQTPPAAPAVRPPAPTGPAAYDWGGAFGFVCASGASHSNTGTKPTVQCGAIARFAVLQFEAGVMGPQVSRSPLSGYMSVDGWIPLIHWSGYPDKKKKGRTGAPHFVGGYTRLFETGHALDYGAGYAQPISANYALEFEARDYWTFAAPNQHNVVFRVVWVLGTPIAD
jgi:hypothetical protein